MFRGTVVGLALALGLVFFAAPAQASSGCVTRGEYDRLEWGLTPNQVENRFETNGWLIDVNDSWVKRGYNPCWDDGDRKVVIWYDITVGLSDHWDVRAN